MPQDEIQNLKMQLTINRKAFEIFKETSFRLSNKLVHDLRSPLTVITLQAELIKMGESLSRHTVEMCLSIIESGKKIDTILRDYLSEENFI